jgi:4-alpha-glucanotransferase
LARSERVDYAGVLDSKRRGLRRVFDHLDHDRLRAELERFAAEQSWVHVYAAYRILSAENGTGDFSRWPRHRDVGPSDLEEILESRPNAWLYQTWLQYHAHRQLLESSRRLMREGVSLMGDVPIMLQEASADFWFHRDLFDPRARAGAPPDVYCEEGQNWDFPIYRWDRLREDGYAWWKRRIRHAAQYYRALRVDHVLGFFRIWRIDRPEGSGADGRYWPNPPIDEGELESACRDAKLRRWLCHRDGPLEPIPEIEGAVGLRHEWESSPRLLTLGDEHRAALFALFGRQEEKRNALWGELGRERLSALVEESDLMLCAEDLGAVPDCVRPTLDDLGIPGLKVERWCRAEDEPERPFWDPAHFPRLSVCSPGLHDASSIRGWWREEDDATRAVYWHRALGKHTDPPADLDPSVLAEVLRRNLRASSQLVLLMLPDCLALDEELRPEDPDDERINIPGTLDPRNWSWRMPLDLSVLARRRRLESRLRELLAVR